MDINNIEAVKRELLSFAKQPNQRTPDDINHIYSLTSSVTFFKKISEEKQNDFIHREACKYLRLQVYQRKEAVFHFGESAVDFFIILKGKVGVLVPGKVSKVKQTHTETELRKMMTQKAYDADNQIATEITKTEEQLKLIFEEQLITQLNILRSANTKLDLKYLKNFGEIERLKEVNILKEGDCFGELSLLSDKPRAATIICKEYCVFATLNKSEFTKILSKEAAKTLETKAEFIQNLPIFARTPKSILFKLSYYFTERLFRKKQLVYKAGDEVGNVYFIKSGEFKLSKWKPIQSRPVIRQGADNLLKFSNAREIKQGLDLDFSIKSSNEIFGQEEIIENLDSRVFSVVCLSEVGVVYTISKLDFISKFSNAEFRKYLKDKRLLTNKRESEIENSEKILTEMRTLDRTQVGKFSNFFDDEFEEIRNRLKNLRKKVKKAVVLKEIETPRFSPKTFDHSYIRLSESVRYTADFNIPSPRTGAKKSEKSSPKSSVLTAKKIKRLPPPNFMIGMRNLSRFYEEDSRLLVVNKRTASQ